MDLNTMITKGLTHLVISELHLCHSYFERLFYAIEHTGTTTFGGPIAPWINHYISEQKSFLHNFWFKRQKLFTAASRADLKLAKDFTRYLFKSLEGIIALEIVDEQERSDLYSQTLNRLYQNAHELHSILETIFEGQINIDLPRTLIMQEQNEYDPVLFMVTPHALENVLADNDNSIESLAIQRERKYESLIKSASELIADKQYEVAKEQIKRALNLKETAKAYNLLSWCNSLEGDIETAKSLCIKAIKVDPAHGAAYNDLGSYLLSQGQTKESLKWFDLAKNSRQYDNREFAFINAGRAYMELREYKKALSEFSLALTLAPDNETLHDTVYKLKERLNRTEIKKDDTAPPPLF